MGIQIGQYPLSRPLIPTAYCDAPLNLQVQVNQDLVRFRWQKPHEVLYFILRLYNGDQELLNSYQVTGQTLELKLEAHSSYNWDIFSVCSELNQSLAVTGPAFNTENRTALCPGINNSSILVTLQPDSVRLTWPLVADAIFYEFLYKPTVGLQDFKRMSLQGNNVVLEYLIPNTAYTYKVRPVCNENTPEYSEEGTFTTPISEDQCPRPILNAVASANTLILAWQFDGRHFDYDIFLNGLAYARKFVGNTFIIPNLTPQTVYVVDVVGNCKGGSSVPSSATLKTDNSPCPKPTNVQTTVQANGTQLQVSWTPVTGALYYVVNVNGVKTVVTETSIIQSLNSDGVTYLFDIQAVCGTNGIPSGYSDYAHTSFTDAFVCKPPSNIVMTSTDKSIHIDWKDVSGAVVYEVRWYLAGDPILIGSGTPQTSEFTIEGLQAATSYDIVLISKCITGDSLPILQTFGTQVLTPCPGFSSVELEQLTDTSVQVHFTMTGNLSNPDVLLRYKRSVDVSFSSIATRQSPIQVTGLQAATDYDFELVHRCDFNDTVYTTSVTTKAACPSLLDVAVVLTDGTEGSVDYTVEFVDVFADTYRLYYKKHDDAEFTLLEEKVGPQNGFLVTFNVPFHGETNPIARRQFKIESIGADFTEGCSKIVDVPCWPVQNLRSEVEGTTVTLIWDKVPGADYYKITLQSQEDGKDEFITSVGSIIIGDLRPFTAYNWFVETFCGSAVSVFSTSAIVTTEEPVIRDEDCDKPTFEVFIQDSDLSDPDSPISSNFIYFGVQFGPQTPSTLPAFISADYTASEFTVPFGNVPDSVYYYVMHKQFAPLKDRFQDLNDINNAGNMGGISDLFEYRSTTIGGQVYDIYITRYPTSFNGVFKRVKFLKS